MTLASYKVIGPRSRPYSDRALVRSSEMRRPRPGLSWSPRRCAIRQQYATYMRSRAWYLRREHWVGEWRRLGGGRDPVCLICGAPWTTRSDDLHHRSYSRLGHESFTDLIALCRSCHITLHQLLETNPEWRKRPREQATDVLVAELRRQQARRMGI